MFVNRRKSGFVVYTIVLAVPVAASVAGVVMLNDLLQTYASSVVDMITNMLWMMGLNRYSIQSVDFFHITSAPVISVLCAVAAVSILCVRNIKLPSQVNSPVVKLTWTCICGAENKLGNAFCASCGQKRPEKPRCECGANIVPGAKFCGKCGKAVEPPNDCVDA